MSTKTGPPQFPGSLNLRQKLGGSWPLGSTVKTPASTAVDPDDFLLSAAGTFKFLGLGLVFKLGFSRRLDIYLAVELGLSNFKGPRTGARLQHSRVETS